MTDPHDDEPLRRPNAADGDSPRKPVVREWEAPRSPDLDAVAAHELGGSDWSAAYLPPPPPPPELPPLTERPLPDLEPIGVGMGSKPRRSILRRLLGWLIKLVLGWFLLSLLMVVLYRFVPVPVTLTMIGDLFAGHGVTKQWRSLEQIDPNMPRAAIAAEDGRFCQHHGFDWKAMEEAYARNQRGGRIRGGSTISQQTAKNVFLWQGGGYFRKGLEAYFTVLIENIWGKRRIMEVYLNVAETGIGTYGVNAGSQRYFGHDASHMSEHEAAQIAAVLPNPKKRPGTAPTGYTRRYGNRIDARIGAVRGGGLDDCLK